MRIAQTRRCKSNPTRTCEPLCSFRPPDRMFCALLAYSQVGTPYKFGAWFPRAALDVPPYTSIYFQNARISMIAPKPKHLPARHLLPKEIFFYVRTMTADVKFPLPEKDYPAAQYLHVARVIPGHEAGGPAAHMVWGIDTVVGLKKHHCTPTGAPHRSMQLVIVVPSSRTVNPGLEPAQLAFSPTNVVQLHLSRKLPRIIVPLYPRSAPNELGRCVDSVASAVRLRHLRALLGLWSQLRTPELKLASFKRWLRVSWYLPKRMGYKPPDPQIGTPYVEVLEDRGEETNRARWPRIDRAAHLWISQTQQRQHEAEDRAYKPSMRSTMATLRSDNELLDPLRLDIVSSRHGTGLRGPSLRPHVSLEASERDLSLESPKASARHMDGVSDRSASPKTSARRWTGSAGAGSDRLDSSQASPLPRAPSPRAASPRAVSPRAVSPRATSPRTASPRAFESFGERSRSMTRSTSAPQGGMQQRASFA